jgi:hypothetical protein
MGTAELAPLCQQNDEKVAAATMNLWSPSNHSKTHSELQNTSQTQLDLNWRLKMCV